MGHSRLNRRIQNHFSGTTGKQLAYSGDLGRGVSTGEDSVLCNLASRQGSHALYCNWTSGPPQTPHQETLKPSLPWRDLWLNFSVPPLAMKWGLGSLPLRSAGALSMYQASMTGSVTQELFVCHCPSVSLLPLHSVACR